MQQSPRGRTIEAVKGNPDDIIARGQDITDLGQLMIDSANTLQAIKDRAIEGGGLTGRAIDALRETVGDSYETLHEAGDLYKPVGPVIKTYGDALAEIQPTIQGHVEECNTRWTTYVNAPGDRDPLFPPDEDSPEAADNQAKQDAYDRWHEEAAAFDSAYDTWEDAYDEAVESIGDGMSGEIKDGWWDNWGSDFFSVLGEILSWAGLVVGILALIIGGPFLAALALVIAVAYLAVTLLQAAHGEKGLLDVTLAVVGIIPFTKVSSLTKLAHLNKGGVTQGLLGNFTKLQGLRTTPILSIADDSLITAYKNGGKMSVVSKLFLGDADGFASFATKHEGLAGNLAQLSSVQNLIKTDAGATFAGNVISHYGKIDQITGGDLLPDVPGPVKLFL